MGCLCSTTNCSLQCCTKAMTTVYSSVQSLQWMVRQWLMHTPCTHALNLLLCSCHPRSRRESSSCHVLLQMECHLCMWVWERRCWSIWSQHHKNTTVYREIFMEEIFADLGPFVKVFFFIQSIAWICRSFFREIFMLSLSNFAKVFSLENLLLYGIILDTIHSLSKLRVSIPDQCVDTPGQYHCVMNVMARVHTV